MKSESNQEQVKQKDKDYHIKSWQASGQRPSIYCRENNLAPSTFRTWLEQSAIKKPAFKKVPIKSLPKRLDEPPVLLVKIGDNLKLYFNTLTDISSIMKLLKELR